MKKFVVKSIQEGWNQINKELGENAIIISIKELQGEFEIIAASPVGKIENKSNISKSILDSLKTEDDIKGLEKILNIAVQLKDKKEEKKKLISDLIESFFLKYTERKEDEILFNRAYKEKLSKKYIVIFGGISTGKTTTIAKLASMLKFNKNKKIAISSFDFFKIGGFDNLKKFAEIMQIPFFPVKNEKDIIYYKDSFEDYDHIIFDTPGNLKNLKEIEKLVGYISDSENSENILTISLDKKENIIKSEIEYFAKFNIDHCILTKFDELVNKKEVFITMSNIPYKVSYITDGLNVPSDIFEFEELYEKLEV